MLHHTTFEFREKLMPRRKDATNLIVIHHSRVTGKHSVREIHAWHRNRKTKDGKMWAGIGYHFYVRKDGEIYVGRPLDTVGAHAYGFNSRSIGVCFEGNFNCETMEDLQLNASVMLLSLLSLAYGNAGFRRHDTLDSKSCCPGTNFPYDRLIARVRTCKRQMVAVFGKAGNGVYGDLLEILMESKD